MCAPKTRHLCLVPLLCFDALTIELRFQRRTLFYNSSTLASFLRGFPTSFCKSGAAEGRYSHPKTPVHVRKSRSYGRFGTFITYIKMLSHLGPGPKCRLVSPAALRLPRALAIAICTSRSRASLTARCRKTSQQWLF